MSSEPLPAKPFEGILRRCLIGMFPGRKHGWRLCQIECACFRDLGQETAKHFGVVTQIKKSARERVETTQRIGAGIEWYEEERTSRALVAVG